MNRIRIAFATVTALLSSASVAHAIRPVTSQGCGHVGAANPIYPSNPQWGPEVQGGAGVGITATNPRAGNGSLELSASGNLADWAFYRRNSADAGGFGLLSMIDCLSFEWFRESLVTPTDVPWAAQTPVLRLYVNDNGVENQLVWEAYYNNGGTPTVNDVWHTENLLSQSLWRWLPNNGTGATNCALQPPLNGNPLATFSTAGWASSGCFSSGAFISAISVGVGSYWPYQYHGFVDNVQLGFAGQNQYAVNDNFELGITTTPEPASVILMATGLLATVGAGWLRRRIQAA